MADPSTNLRVRISADLNDIKQGLALLQGRLAEVRKDAAKPLPANNAVQQLGVSAGQTAAAMRQLPAQFTDIVTSLQGGMPFFTVLLQQGGQIKDSFGGTKQAIAGVASALVGMVNPVTVAAGAVGALVLVTKQAADQQFELQKALILTGNYAGKSVDELQGLVDQLDGLAGVSKSGAADAVAEVAQSGIFAGQQLDQVAAAAARMQASVGQSVDETVSKFKGLAKEPVAALLKLNEAEHFLTQAQLERVQQLEDEGRHQQAVSEAIRVYAANLDSIASRADDAMPAMSKLWRQLKDEISSVVSEAQSYGALIDQLSRKGGGPAATSPGFTGATRLLRSQTMLDLLPDGSASLVNALLKGALGDAARTNGTRSRHTPGRAAADSIVDSRDAEAAIAFEEKTNQLLESQLDLEGQIKKMREDAAKAGVTDAKLLAERERALRGAAAKKAGNGLADATRSAGLQAIKDQAEVERVQRDAGTRALQAQYQARQITIEEYYGRLRTLSQEGVAADAAALEKQIAYLRQQSVAGKDAVSVGQQVSSLEAKLAQVRTQGASAQQQLLDQEQAAIRTRQSSIAAYQAVLDSSTGSLRSQMDAAIARIRMGDREYEIQQRINDVYRERDERLNDLALQRNADQIDQKTYEDELARVKAATDERVQIVQDGYVQLAAAQSDWSNGASAAWANWATEAADAAGQMSNAVGTVFSGLEEQWVSFTTTGKTSFSDLARSVMADLARMGWKQGFSGLLNAAGQAWGPTITGFDGGGYTGPGARLQPAGVVHKGEVVWSQRDIARAGGVGVVEAMRLGRRGYAAGGVVAGAGGQVAGGRYNVNITNAPPGTTASLKPNGQGGFDMEMVLGQVDQYMGSLISQGAGHTYAGMKGRFGVRDAV